MFEEKMWAWCARLTILAASAMVGAVVASSSRACSSLFPSTMSMSPLAPGLALGHVPVTVWGCTPSGSVYVRLGATLSSSGHQWQQVEGALVHIAVEGGGLLWGTNAAGDIFRRLGISPGTPFGVSWEKVEGGLRSVSIAPQAGSNGQYVVWGTNSANDIYMRTGVTAQSAGGAWKHVEGQLTQVHADSSGAVWGVNAGGNIYKRTGVSAGNPAGSGWQQVEGSLKFVTVAAQFGAPLGTSVVWGVNSSDDIYVRAGVTAQSAGLPWVHIPGKLKQIHADAAGAVWGVNAGGNIFRRVNITPANPAGSDWEQVDGNLAHVCCAAELNWPTVSSPMGAPGGMSMGHHHAGGMGSPSPMGHPGAAGMGMGMGMGSPMGHHHAGGMGNPNSMGGQMGHQTAGGMFSPMGQHPHGMGMGMGGQMGSQAVGGMGSPMGHYAAGGMGGGQMGHHHAGMGSPMGHKFPAGNSAVWGVNAGGSVYMRFGATLASPGGQWQQVDGHLVYVHVAADGQVWGTNAGGSIYRRLGVSPQNPAGSGWQQVEGSLKKLSIGSQPGAPFGTAIVWGVNSGDDIFVRSGVTHQSAGSAWQKVEGKLKQVHVDVNGIVWGVNAADAIFRRTGISPANPVGSGWEQVQGSLKFITSGAQAGAPQGTSVVWGVNGQGHIYMRSGVTAHSAGGNWQQVAGSLAQVHADAAGAVWGCNAGGSIYRRTGISPSSPGGLEWAQVEGALTVVSPNAAAVEGMGW